MTKWQVAWAIIQLLKSILVDSDGDGRPDLFDSSPNDSEVR